MDSGFEIGAGRLAGCLRRVSQPDSPHLDFGSRHLKELRDEVVTTAERPDPAFQVSERERPAMGGWRKKERIGWEGARRSASRNRISSARHGARGLGGKKTEQPRTDSVRHTSSMLRCCGAQLSATRPN